MRRGSPSPCLLLGLQGVDVEERGNRAEERKERRARKEGRIGRKEVSQASASLSLVRSLTRDPPISPDRRRQTQAGKAEEGRSACVSRQPLTTGTAIKVREGERKKRRG